MLIITHPYERKNSSCYQTHLITHFTPTCITDFVRLFAPTFYSYIFSSPTSVDSCLSYRLLGIFRNEISYFIYFARKLLIIVLLYHKLSLPSLISAGWITLLIFGLLLTYLIFQLIKILIVIFVRDNYAIEIDFPLKNGKYLITDGGNSKVSRLMNYHFYSPIHRRKGTNNSMKYATDIVRIDSYKKTFLPPENQDYPIFGNKVYSPINGTIVKIENEIEDNIPYVEAHIIPVTQL